jgi:hypothetical protein
VREQLCGQFDLTAARPIRRDSCVANPPGQLRGQSAGTAVRRQRCDRSAGTAARPICRDNCVVNPPEQPRPIRRDSSAANPMGQRCGQSAGIAAPRRQSGGTACRRSIGTAVRGAEARPIRAAGTAVRGQLCGQSAGTSARPICRDSCVVNPPEQPRPIRRESSANNLPGKRCGQSAGTTVRSIRRDSCAANPAGQLAADPSGQLCGGQRRGQSGPQGQRCGDSCAAYPKGQQRGT